MPPPGRPVSAHFVYASMSKSQIVDAKNRSEARSSTEPPNSFLDEALLTCDICLEIMHNPMNVSPCNHKFCATCIYEWLDRKKNCPKCRWSASEVTRDSLFNQVIESYLNAFPSRKRTEAALAALDEAELKHLQKKQAERSRNESDEEDEEEEEEGDYHGGIGPVVNGILPRLMRLREILEDENDDGGLFIHDDIGRDTRYRHAEEDARIERLQRQKEEREARVRQAQAQARQIRAARCQSRRAAPPAGPYNLRNRRRN